MLARDDDVEYETVSLDRVLKAIEPARRLRLVILDSCRSNPFVESMKRSTRAIGRGFARVEPSTPDTLVAFAAKAGSTASDGSSEHSPFTAALLKHLATPGLDVGLALRQVRDTVMASTSPRQEPFVYGSLGGKMIPIVDAPTIAAPTLAPPGEAERAWRAIQSTPNIAMLEAFVRRYPESFYTDLARLRIEDLKKSQTAVVILPVVPAVVAPAASGPCGGTVTVSFSTICAATLTRAQERGLKPKDSFKECANCPEMVVVPSGSFTMGSPPSEKEHANDEGPQHHVTFARSFAVGQFAVTFDEWDACVASGGCNGYKPQDEGWGRGRRPVINVSWDDAQTYVAWLNRTTDKTYRLLSEAEREYVARAGTTTPFWWGSSISTEQANYDDRHFYGGVTKGEYREKTLPVDSFQPNAWGLYQVHGNVWEWTLDCYRDSYKGAPIDGSVWASKDCGRRVLRGGSWNLDSKNLRAAVRYRNSPDRRISLIGFRVGRTLVAP